MKAECEARTVLITGATDGLGKAAALLLAERGYRVFAAGRSAEKRAQLDALAREKKLPLETLELDVCDDASVKAAVSKVLGKSGAIDVLVNNAGLVYGGAVEDLRMEDWRRQFETNFFGVIRVTQAILTRLHRDEHPADGDRSGPGLPGKNQERPVREDLRHLLGKRKKHTRAVQDYAGGLCAHYAQGDRSATAQGALLRDPAGEVCEMGQAAAER